MADKRYLNSPVASQLLAQSIGGLLAEQRLTPDARCAAFMAPFRFHPVRDRAFYENRYWSDASSEETRVAARAVMQRFHSWYPKAGPMEKTRLVITALLDSFDAFETIVDDALLELNTRYRLELLDADDSVFYTSDFKAVRDPENIRSVLDTDPINYWVDIFRQQLHRVIAAPPVEYETFQRWDDLFCHRHEVIADRFNHCPFTQAGYSVSQGRRILVRSLNLLTSLIGTETVRDFVQGHEIYLRGPQLIWGLKTFSNMLIKNTMQPPIGHCPYRISLYNDQMVRLADACVLFAGLPVMDQAAGIVLGLCNAEEEINLLRDCNVFLYTREGKECELLRPFNKERDRADADLPFDPDYEMRPAWNLTQEPLPRLTDPALDDDSDGTEVRPAEIEEYVEDWRTDTDNFPRADQRQGNFFNRVSELSRWHREQRASNPVARLLLEHLFQRIGGPRDLLAYMAQPEIYNIWYGPKCRRLPEGVISYINTKVIKGVSLVSD